MNNLDFSFFVTEGYKKVDLNIILISIFIGIIIASVAIVYRRYVLGNIVKRIVEKKAFSEDSAITLEEMGYNNVFMKFALREGSTFKKTVHRVADEQKNVRYFIPEEIYMREEIKYCKKNTNIIGIIVAAVLFFLVFYLLLNYVPWVVDGIKDIFSSKNA